MTREDKELHETRRPSEHEVAHAGKDSERAKGGERRLIGLGVTEQARLEKTLWESEEKYRALVENSPNLIGIFQDGVLKYINNTSILTLGWSYEELASPSIDPIEKVVSPKSRSLLKENLSKRLRGEDVALYEISLTKKDGSEISVNVRATRIIYQGKPAIEFSFADITERKQAEESKSYLAAIVESSDDAIIGKTLDGVISSWNRGAEKLYGYSAEEVEGKRISILIPPDRPDELAQILERVKRGETVQRYETQRARKDGTIIEVSLTVSPIRDPAGRIIGASTIARDITERKKAEEQLAYQARLLENVNDAIVSTDSQFTIRSWNRQAEKMYGWKADEVLGRSSAELLRSEYPGISRAKAIQELAEKGQFHHECIQSRKDGTRINTDVGTVGLRDGGGEIIGYVSVNRDITQRRNAEEATARLAAIVEFSDDAIIGKTLDGVITTWNRGAEEQYGYSGQEAIGQSVNFLIPPDRPDELTHLLERIGRGELVQRFNTKRVRKDGKIIDVSVTASPIEDSTGRIVGASTIARDITERKRAEEALRQSEERYHSLFDRMLDGVYLSTHEGRFVDVNPALVSMFGYSSKQEMLDITDIKKELYFSPEERGSHILDTDQLEVKVYRMRRKDGSGVWVEDHGGYVHDEQGNIVYHEGILRDITERKQLEEELKRYSLHLEELVAERTGKLRESEEKYRELFEASPVSLWEEDFSAVKQFVDELRLKGVSDFAAYLTNHPEDVARCAGLVKVLNMNKATLDLYGAKSADEIIGGLGEVLTEDSNRGFVSEVVALVQGKRYFEGEFENKTLGGETKYCNVICAVVPGYEQTLAKVLVCIVDLTSQKRMEEKNRKLTSEVTERLLGITDQVNSLAKVRERLKTVPDVSSGLDIILETALWDFDLDFGAILVLDRQANEMKVRASKGKERKVQLEDNYPLEAVVGLKDLPTEGVTRILGEGDRSLFNSATECLIPINSGKGLFGVMVFGKVTRDLPEAIGIRILKMYADLVYSFVLERSVTVTPVLEKQLETIATGHRTVDSGQVYLVRNDPTKAFEIFADLVFSGYQGLGIARTHPSKIRSKYKLEKTPIIWLTSEAPGEETSVKSIPELSIMIGGFLDKAEKPVILFEGFEYLILNDGFKYFIKFLQIIKDRVQRKNGILIAPFSEQTLDPRELALLKVETTTFSEEAHETGERNFEHNHPTSSG
jgi:PAS domain S-box-containing protein